jgi:membrane protease YdiL (CAAX protease family)
MNELPPDQPVPPESAPAEPVSRSSAGTVISWVVILACIGLVVYRNVQGTRRLVEKDENPTSAVQMKLLARTAIGFKALAAQSAGPTTAGSAPATATSSSATTVPSAHSPVTSANLEQVIKSIDELANTPEEKLRGAIISAELKGAPEALRRLDAIDAASPPAPLAEDIKSLRVVYTRGPEVLDQAARQRLIDRQNYFANVALTFGMPASVEPRKSLEESGLRTAVLLGIGGIGLLLFLMLAGALLITAIVLMATGKIRRAYVPDAAAGSAYLEAFALCLALLVLWMLRGVLSGLGWQWLTLALIVVMIAWLRFRKIPLGSVLHGIGWYRGRGAHIEIPMGIAGYLAGVPVVATGLFITTRLIKYTHASPTHPIVHMLSGNGWHVLMLYAAACLIAPVLEETLFRGALFNHLRQRWGWLISACVVAFVFAIIHPQGWTFLPTLGAIAVVLAALREWRGSLIASITAHALNNFIVLTLAMLVLR